MLPIRGPLSSLRAGKAKPPTTCHLYLAAITAHLLRCLGVALKILAGDRAGD
jgi:hypothetical protein